jgi:hypothetical protein
MQRIPSCGADLSDRDVERLIERAKIARSEFLRDNRRRVFGAFGLTALACGFAVLLILGAGSTRHQVLEKTALMERLATALADARMIPPKTARDIAQLIRQPQYDCRQLACDAWLERRNLAARARLETILARDALPDDVADNNLSS